MKLLTKELLDRFAKVGSQEEVPFGDKIVIAKYFNPVGLGTWYATEYDPKRKEFFGYADITDGEWGYFSLTEMESVKLRFGLGIERDLYIGEKTIREVVPKAIIHEREGE